MKTIIRVLKNEFNHVQFYFQCVESFKVVRNENIQYLDDKINYTDWIKSGDLINCDFSNRHGDFIFDCEYRNDIEFSINNRLFSSYKLNELKKEITRFNRVEKNIYSDIEKIGEYLGTIDFKILLNIFFNRFNVIGGTIEINNIKHVYNGCNKSEFINSIIEVLK